MELYLDVACYVTCGGTKITPADGRKQAREGWTLATHSDWGVDCWLVPLPAPASSGTAAHCTQLVAQTYCITFTQPAALGAALHVTAVAAGHMHRWRELPRRLTATYVSGFSSPLAHQRLLEWLWQPHLLPRDGVRFILNSYIFTWPQLFHYNSYDYFQ